MKIYYRVVQTRKAGEFIRTSVDHGTAYDIAGKNEADEGSLIEAVLLAARLAGGPLPPPTAKIGQ